MEAILRAEALSIGYGGRPLLAPLALELAAGEVVALQGPSGAGKTTLLRTLCGLIDPLAGRVQLDGRSPQTYGWAGFRRRIPLVAQQPVLLAGSVRANLERPFSYRSGAGRAFDAAAARAWLERLALPSSCFDRPTAELSVGEQQRVCIVRALLLEPTVLLLDEATGALDPATADRVEAALRDEVRCRRLGVLMATHRVERAERWCDRRVDLAGRQLPRGATLPAPLQRAGRS